MPTAIQQAAGILASLQLGQPYNVGGSTRVEKMLGGLYRVNGGSKLLTTQEVLPLLAESAKKKKKTPALDPNPVPRYPDSLRGISVGGCFGYLLCTGEKTHEVRTRSTSFRGWALVHIPTGKHWDFSFEEFGVAPDKCPKTSIIGAIRIDDVDYNAEKDIYGYYAGAYALFDQPILDPEGVKGKRQAIWRPEPEPSNIRAFNQAWDLMTEHLSDPDWQLPTFEENQ